MELLWGLVTVICVLVVTQMVSIALFCKARKQRVHRVSRDLEIGEKSDSDMKVVGYEPKDTEDRRSSPKRVSVEQQQATTVRNPGLIPGQLGGLTPTHKRGAGADQNEDKNQIKSLGRQLLFAKDEINFLTKAVATLKKARPIERYEQETGYGTDTDTETAAMLDKRRPNSGSTDPPVTRSSTDPPAPQPSGKTPGTPL
jgi:hypothetical protein